MMLMVLGVATCRGTKYFTLHGDEAVLLSVSPTLGVVFPRMLERDGGSSLSSLHFNV